LHGQMQEISRLLERVGPVRENDAGNLRVLQASVNAQTKLFELLRLVKRKKLVRLHSHTSKLLDFRYPRDQFFPGQSRLAGERVAKGATGRQMSGEASEAVARRARAPPDSLG